MDIIAIERKTFMALVERINLLESQYAKQIEELKRDRLYNSKEVMEILRVGSTSLQNYRDTGKLAYIKTGNTIRYRWAHIQSFLSNHR